MITTATRKTMPDTFTLTVPKADVNFYDPETGDYLNDATMKVIENARKGKDVIEVGSMDEYLKLVNNL